MTRPILVLIGPPGAGKSTVGALVAESLGVSFRDTDRDVERSAGKPISDIFIEDGEAHFRELEQRAVREALLTHPGVLALGGGAVLAEQTRALLAGHRVVYLSVGLPHAARRVGLGRDRPVLTLNPRAQLRVLLDARRPIYESIADLTVPTDDRSPDEVAAEVRAHVG